ncbi:MAG: hypothetical protein FWG59_06365 [Betaproteobacteria bacterium]|nr:hypothetical protein [Betaproteobacteria bacterium]
MPQFRCELFGHFIFAEELSYTGLLEKEARLKGELSELFIQAGFVHMHFTSTGDFLLVQGVAVEHDQDLFQEMCEAISQLLDESVEARLLFVDRFLDSVYFYVLNNERWQESFLEWPLPKDVLPKGKGGVPPRPTLPALTRRRRGQSSIES